MGRQASKTQQNGMNAARCACAGCHAELGRSGTGAASILQYTVVYYISFSEKPQPPQPTYNKKYDQHHELVNTEQYSRNAVTQHCQITSFLIFSVEFSMIDSLEQRRSQEVHHDK